MKPSVIKHALPCKLIQSVTLCVFLALPSLICQGANQVPEKTLEIIYPNTVSAYYAEKERYLTELLLLALEKSGTPYTARSVKMIHHSQSRSVSFLQSGMYSVYWLNTSIELEKELLPIRIPLYKGLIGWRLLLVRETQKNEFSNISTLADLKKFTALQADDWPDTAILKDNGFSLKTSTGYYNLFRMLSSKRGDFFPRGITEIWNELDSYENENLTVDKHIALHYSAAYYFFVNKSNMPLKKAIEKGLNIAIADGSFNQIFMRHTGNSIKKAVLENKKIFSLRNPNMPPETPFNREELWFSVSDFNKDSHP